MSLLKNFDTSIKQNNNINNRPNRKNWKCRHQFLLLSPSFWTSKSILYLTTTDRLCATHFYYIGLISMKRFSCKIDNSLELETVHFCSVEQIITISVKKLWIIRFSIFRYASNTPTKLKIVDAYLGYIFFTGVIQFVYCCLVGTFPFNAFLSGFISCVGSFILGVCLRYVLIINWFG